MFLGILLTVLFASQALENGNSGIFEIILSISAVHSSKKVLQHVSDH